MKHFEYSLLTTIATFTRTFVKFCARASERDQNELELLQDSFFGDLKPSW